MTTELLAAVGSPCTNVCRMDSESGWCLGCKRSIDEIVAWSRMGDEQKQAVWLLLPDRRVASDLPGVA